MTKSPKPKKGDSEKMMIYRSQLIVKKEVMDILQKYKNKMNIPAKGVGGRGNSLWESVGEAGIESNTLLRRVNIYWSSPSRV